MKAKGLRIVANLILWIGVVASLVGLALALLISNELIPGLATDYQPTTTDYIILGSILVAAILIAIILHAIACVKEKRARIAACWAEAEVEAATVLDEEPVEEEIVEEIIEEEPAEEIVEETEEVVEAPKTKLDLVRAKIVEKTPITEEQLAKAEKIGKIALPIAGACIVVGMAAKLNCNRKKAARRRALYDWLG